MNEVVLIKNTIGRKVSIKRGDVFQVTEKNDAHHFELNDFVMIVSDSHDGLFCVSLSSGVRYGATVRVADVNNVTYDELKKMGWTNRWSLIRGFSVQITPGY